MENFDIYDKIDIRLKEHQYRITICRDGLHHVQLLQTLVSSSQVLIVTNKTVAPLYLKALQSAFVSIQCDVVLLEDGERYKNQESLFTIYEALIQNKHHRDTTLIALGGGVIGDITGFAASTYQRGVRFIQIPTTLLAQIDASLGGKTAINHPLGKNMIGSFYQPQAVLIDINTLNTLPPREFRAGLAEMIKYGLLAGGSFFTELIQAVGEGLEMNHPLLPQFIAECCRIKAQFVEQDEKEKGCRALLNLGHTFAHALEAYTHYQKWLHGEAVAIGLYCAALLSYELHLIDEKLVREIKQLLQNAGLPYHIPDTINLEALIDLMRLDKKIKKNQLPFVLIKKPGVCYLETDVNKDCLYAALGRAVQGESNE